MDDRLQQEMEYWRCLSGQQISRHAMYARHALRQVSLPLLLTIGIFANGKQSTAQVSVRNPPVKSNSVVIELFYRNDSDQSLNAKQFLAEFQQQRQGIEVRAYDVLQDRDSLVRLWKLSKQFGYEKAGAPTFHLCNSLKVGFGEPESAKSSITQLLTIRAFVRPGCKHCKAATKFLNGMANRWPALRVEYHDVINDRGARVEIQQLASKHHVPVASFPCIEVAGRLVVGYQSDEITGRSIESYFINKNIPDKGDDKQGTSAVESETDGQTSATLISTSASIALQSFRSSLSYVPQAATLLGFAQLAQTPNADAGSVPEVIVEGEPDGRSDELAFDAVPMPDAVPLPADVAQNDFVIAPDGLQEQDQVEVPFLGTLSVSKLGLPTFTILIGLVDGFNPCAMWVLIFLLSVLVNIKDRTKIVIVAGTFVIISGLAYFVFMAAWFSVFQLVGFLRPVQIGLGVVAIVIGVVNIKDFFAFHRGITFSIPESAKPGIYRRVRKIVSANYLATALTGAVVLAIVVNIVELLCTAGLPALYTQVLSMQQLPTWASYSYIGLYIMAYMLDDALLVAVVVATMSRRRLQESEGRWLKLVSGVVILMLGCVMLLRPELLI